MTRFAKLLAAGSLAIGILWTIVVVQFLPALDQSKPALANVLSPVGPAPPRLARRVVLVIADGLRLDASRGLPVLDGLRTAGIDATALAGFPTLSVANHVTLLTGVEPRWSGVRTNGYRFPVPLDSLADRLAAAGMRIAYATDRRRSDRMGTPWERVLPVAAARDEDLLVINASEADAAGHLHGGASAGYRATVRTVDREIGEVLAGVDLSKVAVVIVADHGHTDRGGHGGVGREVIEVPLVLAGAGLRPGTQVADARLADVAPTIAALLGVPAPTHAMGRTLVEALAVTPAAGRLLTELDAERHARLMPAIESIERSDLARHARARRWRAALAIIAMIAVIAVVVLAVRHRWIVVDNRVLIAAAVPAIAFYGSLALVAWPVSPAHVPGDPWSVLIELARYVSITGSAYLIALLLVAWRRLPLDRVAAVAATTLLAAGSMLAPALAAWALAGEPLATMLPSPALVMITPITAAGAACTTIVGALAIAALGYRARHRALVSSPR